MSDVWYRGESTNYSPAKTGAWDHDFGDGYYFSDAPQVAAQYADVRVSESGGQPRVLMLNVKHTMLGRVLDLEGPQWGSLWRKYLDTVLPTGRTRRQYIHDANQNYYSFFAEFTQQNGLKASDYDSVIGPELVRGGRQLCVLHKSGQISPIADNLRRQLQEVPRIVSPKPENVPVISATPSRSVPGAGELMAPKSGIRRTLGNPAVGTAIAVAVAAAAQYLNEKSIRQDFINDVDRRLADHIQKCLDRGSGVLLIIMINQREDFMTGVTYRRYSSADYQPGPNQEAALKAWRKPPQIRGNVPLANNVLVEEYVWIEPR